jgi:hypothetical protein
MRDALKGRKRRDLNFGVNRSGLKGWLTEIRKAVCLAPKKRLR